MPLLVDPNCLRMSLLLFGFVCLFFSFLFCFVLVLCFVFFVKRSVSKAVKLCVSYYVVILYVMFVCVCFAWLMVVK